MDHLPTKSYTSLVVAQDKKNHKLEQIVRHEFQKLYHECPDADHLLTAPNGTNKIKQAINEIKQEKSTRTDGIYLKIIKNLGEKALAWLDATISNIIKIFKYSEF